MNSLKPKKIIYAWNYLEWGGAQVYFLGIAARIKNRVSVSAVLPEKTGKQLLNFCRNLEIPYQFLKSHNDLQPAPNLKRKIERHFHKLSAELALLKHLKKMDLTDTVVHVELAPWQSLFSLIRLSRKTKVFMTMHNRLPEVSKFRFWWWKSKFRIITKFKNFHLFASNRDAKTSLAPFVSRQFLEQVKVTYTNVNPDEIDEALEAEFDRPKILQKFGLPADKFLVCCLGQFIDRKGRWTFLEAAKTLQEEEVVFVWVSNSELSGEELKKIAEFGLGDRFFLLSSETVGADHLELMKFMRAADCFTLPSFQEGLPISLLEAMALGIPSISTNVNAIPEAIRDGETGLLIEAGDHRGLARAICRLQNDENLRKTLSNNGRQHVLENFNEKTVAEIAFSAYTDSFGEN